MTGRRDLQASPEGWKAARVNDKHGDVCWIDIRRSMQTARPPSATALRKDACKPRLIWKVSSPLMTTRHESTWLHHAALLPPLGAVLTHLRGAAVCTRVISITASDPFVVAAWWPAATEIAPAGRLSTSVNSLFPARRC
jgi:hypothetical protein